MTLDPTIARIADKLAEVRRRGCSCFGAESHGFELDAPLDDAEVTRLEAELGVALPDDYRRFLVQLAARGAGPFYGLTAPVSWRDHLDGDTPVPDYAARPFVWTPSTPRDDDTWRTIAATLDEPLQGSIALGTQGCAYFSVLVVSGEARGRVAYVNLDGGVPFFPEPPGFLAWYERWLDELRWGHDVGWFAMTMPGDADTLTAAAGEGDPQRLEALRAMHRLPHVEGAVADVVCARVDDPDPAVRAVALSAAAKGGLVARVEDRVRTLTHDGDPGVRLAALRALRNSGCAWVDEAKRALNDGDEDVVLWAQRELAKEKALTADAVIALLSHDSARVREAAASTAREVDDARVLAPLLERVQSGDPAETIAYASAMVHVKAGRCTDDERARFFAATRARLARATEGVVPTAAVRALGWFAERGDDDARTRLRALCESPRGFVRFEAVTVLGEVGRGDDDVAVLRARLGDGEKPMERTEHNGTRSVAWTVGENAKRALARVEGRREG